MSEWLYGKDAYYSRFRAIGKGGDFYTAVSSSMFFGGSIANRLIKTIDEGFLDDDTTIVEIGAHKGYMLADIVQFIYTLKPDLLKTLNFVIIEPHKENIKAQNDYFKDSFGDIVTLKHYPSFEDVQLDSAFVVANELFDAFSCEVIRDDLMLYVDQGKLYFDKQDSFTSDIVQRYALKRGEVALGYEEFAKTMAKNIKRFEFVTFDYGEREPRVDYSLRIYHKHQVYPFFALTPFVEDESVKPKGVELKDLFGKSDLTYDVNFSHLIDAFSRAGVKCEEYKTQMSMLVSFGVIDLLDMLLKNSDEQTYNSEMNRLKVLIDPAFMGERFKGVIFRKV
jgi:SAM-dependent MidA family methyltransferase